jgi:hypothetical protein
MGWKDMIGTSVSISLWEGILCNTIGHAVG